MEKSVYSSIFTSWYKPLIWIVFFATLTCKCGNSNQTYHINKLDRNNGISSYCCSFLPFDRIILEWKITFLLLFYHISILYCPKTMKIILHTFPRPDTFLNNSFKMLIFSQHPFKYGHRWYKRPIQVSYNFMKFNIQSKICIVKGNVGSRLKIYLIWDKN